MSQNLWATIMPFGPVTNILLAQAKFFGPAWPSVALFTKIRNYSPYFLE
jgi:hypothetical protein